VPSIGFPELVLILVIVLLVFGAGKLPQLGRGMGEAIRNFKQGMKDEDTSTRPTDTKS
jgi:sec-independent protein translocase protein TatA